MPITPPPIIQEPIYHAAPNDVQTYLISRGWTCRHDNTWSNSREDLYSEFFQWPEALAYEIFQNFVMLKNAGE